MSTIYRAKNINCYAWFLNCLIIIPNFKNQRLLEQLIKQIFNQKTPKLDRDHDLYQDADNDSDTKDKTTKNVQNKIKRPS